MPKRILLIDNYDSFTFNLFQLVRNLNGDAPTVVRNDKITIAEVADYDGILFSPGPGLPSEAGAMPAIIQAFETSKPMLGVCLGHQAIAEHFGATLENMSELCHGVAIDTLVYSSEDALFRGIASPFPSGRYHSWVVSDTSFPTILVVTARDPEGRIMALRHSILPIFGVQFHPESVLTPSGRTIISNWIESI